MAWQTDIPNTAGFLTAQLVGTVGSSGNSSGGVGKPGTGASTVTGVAIQKNSTTDVSFVVTSLVGVVSDALIGLYLIHPNVGDLELRLLSPLGTSVIIFDNRGGSGDDIGSQSSLCIFDDDAPALISAGAAPFTGVFRPDNPMTAFGGQAPNGTWKLRVVNSGSQNGTLGIATLMVGTTSQQSIGGKRSTGLIWPR